jgi:hypothetical protein
MTPSSDPPAALVDAGAKPASNEPMRSSRDTAESLWATALWVLIPLGLVAFAIMVLSDADLNHPARFALVAAPLFGLPAYIITAVVNARSRRQSRNVDALRALCWTLFGCGLGIGACPGGGKFGVFFPQYLLWTQLGGVGLMVASVAFIIFLTAKFPPPPDDNTPYCDACGYNLTGNETGVCPECGEQVKRREHGDVTLYG